MCAAPCNAARPMAFSRFTFAPSDSANSTAANDSSGVTRVSAGTCPNPAATINGDVSSSVPSVASAPAVDNTRISSTFPSIAANQNGVAPMRPTRKRPLAKPYCGGFRSNRTLTFAPCCRSASTTVTFLSSENSLSDSHSFSRPTSMPCKFPVSSVCHAPDTQCNAV